MDGPSLKGSRAGEFGHSKYMPLNQQQGYYYRTYLEPFSTG